MSQVLPASGVVHRRRVHSLGLEEALLLFTTLGRGVDLVLSLRDVEEHTILDEVSMRQRRLDFKWTT